MSIASATAAANRRALLAFVAQLHKETRLATGEEVANFCKQAGIRVAGFICQEVQDAFWAYYRCILSNNCGKWELYPKTAKAQA